MKELLYSKRFKKNLAKWLFMYVGVMCLLTSVITYSKYISSMHSSDNARAAKFDVTVTYDDICAGKEDTCNMGLFRPTEQYEFYFTVDTTELEVSTLLLTTIKFNDDFKNIKLYDVTEGEIEFSNYTKEGNQFTITENILLGNQYIRHYKAVCEFNSDIDDDYSANYDYNDALVVGYSATQIK